jgi:hypothetical protein
MIPLLWGFCSFALAIEVFGHSANLYIEMNESIKSSNVVLRVYDCRFVTQLVQPPPSYQKAELECGPVSGSLESPAYGSERISISRIRAE